MHTSAEVTIIRLTHCGNVCPAPIPLRCVSKLENAAALISHLNMVVGGAIEILLFFYTFSFILYLIQNKECF